MRNAISSWAAEVRAGVRLGYPPSDEGRLTHEETAALDSLQLSSAARSALRKIVRAAASAPLFHLFCLLDGLPIRLTRVAEWPTINLQAAVRDRPMMHDDFGTSYSQYAEQSGAGTSVP